MMYAGSDHPIVFSFLFFFFSFSLADPISTQTLRNSGEFSTDFLHNLLGCLVQHPVSHYFIELSGFILFYSKKYAFHWFERGLLRRFVVAF